jgi:hypothetical protein
MKERPIIFNGEMVRAILDGRKTQTRRVVKGIALEWLTPNMFTPEYVASPDNHLCPYGIPGDRLWVKETFTLESSLEVGPYDPPFHDGRPLKKYNDEARGEWWEQPHYRATDPIPELEIGTGDPGVKWKPSIHMPRWASRITLEIVKVRLSKIRETSPMDAISEGIERSEELESFNRAHVEIARFRNLWDSINAKRGFSWDANPWVWVIEFKPLDEVVAR